jgi:uncharacterized protein with GYD domain
MTGERVMPTYVLLSNFTDQGIRNIQDTGKRAEAFRDYAKSKGVTVKDLYYTHGPYDLVVILDAPDEATLTALVLGVSKLGNVRGQTLRAFSAAEIPSARTRRVSRGSMMPSSHSRAVPNSTALSASRRKRRASLIARQHSTGAHRRQGAPSTFIQDIFF